MTLLRDPVREGDVPLESESDWLESARSFVLEPDTEPEIALCGSCGMGASVRRWYATMDPTLSPEMLCGRCAIASMGSTVGVIANLLFDLGAAGA